MFFSLSLFSSVFLCLFVSVVGSFFFRCGRLFLFLCVCVCVCVCVCWSRRRRRRKIMIITERSADGHYELKLNTKAVVYYNGLVEWKPPATFKSACDIDVEYFPLDIQTCILKLGSWTYAGSQVSLFFFFFFFSFSLSLSSSLPLSVPLSRRTTAVGRDPRPIT